MIPAKGGQAYHDTSDSRNQMKRKVKKIIFEENDTLISEVEEYLTKFSFPLAFLISRKFKIGFSRAEKILREIEEKKQENT